MILTDVIIDRRARCKAALARPRPTHRRCTRREDLLGIGLCRRHGRLKYGRTWRTIVRNALCAAFWGKRIRCRA